jgi:hypothetical protein
MNKEILTEWYKLYRQVENGYHMSKQDWQELVRLNHLLMEATHKIHNDNMLKEK